MAARPAALAGVRAVASVEALMPAQAVQVQVQEPERVQGPVPASNSRVRI